MEEPSNLVKVMNGQPQNQVNGLKLGTKDIQIILRLFLVIAMDCQASSSQFKPVQASFFQSLNLYHCLLAGKEAQVHAVGRNSLETTYIIFELPYLELQSQYYHWLIPNIFLNLYLLLSCISLLLQHSWIIDKTKFVSF